MYYGRLTKGNPKQFVHKILSNFSGFLNEFATAGLTGTVLLLGGSIFTSNTGLRTVLLLLGSLLGVISGIMKLALSRLFEYGEKLINDSITSYRKKHGI